jgi:hypothetical protein
MASPILSNPRWAVGVVLDLTVTVLAVRNRLYRYLPWFTAYLISLATVELADYLVGAKAGIYSPQYFYAFWLSQALWIALRAVVVVELCHRIFAHYAGIWRLSRLVLGALYALLLLVAGIMAYLSHGSSLETFITTTVRGMELAIVATLVSAILFSRYYQLKIETVTAMITGGLIFYSGIQMINSEILRSAMGSYFSFYSEIRTDSFAATMLIWMAAVWKPFVEAKAPEMLNADVYAGVMPEMNVRLRRLNSRLSEILK